MTMSTSSSDFGGGGDVGSGGGDGDGVSTLKFLSPLVQCRVKNIECSNSVYAFQWMSRAELTPLADFVCGMDIP